MIIGNVDQANAERCIGWALDNENKGKPVSVRILVNGELCKECLAANKRADVEKTRGALLSGFNVEIAGFLKAGKNTVTVMAGSGKKFRQIGGAVIDTRRPGDFVEVGVGGWLFLQNDSNDIVSNITGQSPLSPEKLKSSVENLRSRKAFCEARGIRAVTFIIPEKGVVLNHFRKQPLEISDNRPAVQLQRAAGPFAESGLYYGLEDLQSHPERDQLYWQTDTHMSETGSSFVFHRIMELLGHKAAISLGAPRGEQLFGDLGSKLKPRQSQSILRHKPIYYTRVLFDEVTVAMGKGGQLRQSRLYHRSERNDGSRVALFGTSSAYQMRELLFATFEHVNYYWRNRVDRGTLLDPKPDFLISILHERFLGGGLQDDFDVLVPIVPRLVVPRRRARVWRDLVRKARHPFKYGPLKR